MSAEQLCFFKFPRPLLERFGKEFFGGIPSSPGVYIFNDSAGRALYVGHSQNLRLRLSYYKNAQPEREPRRIVRLVHQTQRIAVEYCETVRSAQIRELALIRQLRPKFNVANSLSATYSFFAIGQTGDATSLRLTMTQSAHAGESIVGGFKNRSLCARAFSSIARTITSHTHPVVTVYDFPVWLNSKSKRCIFQRQWEDSVCDFLAGRSDHFLNFANDLVQKTEDRFLRQVYEGDLLALSDFAQSAREMLHLRRAHEVEILSQEALQVSSRLIPRAATESNFTPQDSTKPH